MYEQFFLLGSLDKEEVARFTAFLNGCANQEGLFLKIIVNSTGGSVICKDILVSMINEFDHQLYIETAESAALDLVSELKGAIQFLPLAHGLYHLGTTYVPYRDGLTSNSESRAKENFCKEELGRTMSAMFNMKVTDEERLQILDGRDVYFSRDRLKEMFKERDIEVLKKLAGIT